MSNQVFPNGQILVSSAQTSPQIENLFQALVVQIFGFAITNSPPPFNTVPVGGAPEPQNAWAQVRVGWQQQGQPGPLIGSDTCIITAVTENHPYSQTRDQLMLSDPGYDGTSSTDLTIGTGSQSFTTQPGLSFLPGQTVSLTYALNMAVTMQGTIVSYNASSGAMIITVTSVAGSGTYSNWTLELEGFPPTVVQQMQYTQIWGIHFTNYGPNCQDRARLIISALSLDWANDILNASNLYPASTSGGLWQRPLYVPENFQGQWWPRCDARMQYNENVLESLIIPAAASVAITVLDDNGFSETVLAQQ
jgi:hypothetical protein